MKNNNNDHQIKQARNHKVSKALHTDILVIPEVVEENMRKISQNPPRRRRRVNYEKKILNDMSIFNA